MLALHTRAKVSALSSRRLFKVLNLSEASEGTFPLQQIVLDLREEGDAVNRDAMANLGFGGALLARDDGQASRLFSICELADSQVVASGDVIRLGNNGQIS